VSASDPNLAIAFHHAPMGVVVAQPDGVIIACNPAAGQLLDRDPSDLLGGPGQVTAPAGRVPPSHGKPGCRAAACSASPWISDGYADHNVVRSCPRMHLLFADSVADQTIAELSSRGHRCSVEPV
jgi:hypothetical protein